MLWEVIAMRRLESREDAEATTKATERKTQGHYRNDEPDGEMEPTGFLSLSLCMCGEVQVQVNSHPREKKTGRWM